MSRSRDSTKNRSRDSKGRFVSETEGGGEWVILVAFLLMAVLLLKGLGLLQLWIGVDPYGVDVNIDLTSLASLGLFFVLLRQMFSLQRGLKTDFRRVDENLSKIESRLATLEERTKKF